MAVAAVYAMWPWDDLATALVPNGRLLDHKRHPGRRRPSPRRGGQAELDHASSTASTEANYLAPPGADPSADLTAWDHEVLAGEPYRIRAATALRILQTYKSAIGIPLPAGGPAPTAIQSGWTDTLFPVSEALHYADRVRAAESRTPMLLMFDDVGHGWAQGKAGRRGRHQRPRPSPSWTRSCSTHRSPQTGVVAIAQTCPGHRPLGRRR